MTRLPVDSWNIKPRLDIPPYLLNTVCPVTGETSGLEDHHVFRRSFTGLGADNRDLYWVEVIEQDGSSVILPNRVALSPEAHLRLTTNRADLRYEDGKWWWEEADERYVVCMDLHIGSAVKPPRKKRRKPDEEARKTRKTIQMRVPATAQENGAEVFDTLVEEVTRKLAPEMGWDDDVPPYYPVTASLAKTLQD